MNTMIDLRSDTVTRPSKEMLEAMMSAQVGDDVFGDDPTVNKLQEMAARLFGMDAALFCPSGTMANQVAIKAHTKPGDEIICDEGSHVYRYEGGGIGFNSGCSVRLIQGDFGRITANQVIENINPDNEHYPVTRLVAVENTCNRGGGSMYDIREMEKIGVACKKHNLQLHLDGARLFNAIVETGDRTTDYGQIFNSISICLSKGLGAPVGSLLMGDSDLVNRARRIRKVFGGGMRQAGFLAAAGIYALNNNINRLKDDHARARILGKVLSNHALVEEVFPVETNIIIFKLKSRMTADSFIDKLQKKGLLATKFGPQTVRFVTHLDFTDAALDNSLSILNGI